MAQKFYCDICEEEIDTVAFYTAHPTGIIGSINEELEHYDICLVCIKKITKPSTL